NLYRLTSPDVKRMKTSIGGRWIRFVRRRNIGSVEIRGEDVLGTEPAGASLGGYDPLQIQDYIASNVSPGERLVLRSLNIEGDVRYSVLHQDQLVGVTSQEFGRDIKVLLPT